MDCTGPFLAAKVLHATGQLPIAFEQRYGTDTKLGSTITITGRDGNNDRSKDHVYPTDGKHGVECMVKMTFEKLTAALKRLKHDANGKVEQLGRVCAGDVSTLYDDCVTDLIANDGENRKDGDYEAIQQYIIQGTTDCTNPHDVQYAAWDQGLDTKGLTVKPSEHVLKQSWRWRQTCLEWNRRLRTAKRRCDTSSLTWGPTFRTSSRKIKPPGRTSRWMTSPST